MTRNLRKLYSAALAMLVTLLLPVVVLAAGKEIIILHTNDIHCGVADNLGIDKVSQYKKDLKKQGHPVALVDAGDAIQGAPIGTLSNGESIVKIMNAVGFDFVIPGNHEFDYGMERFLKLASRQKCGYYSCNFVDVKTRKPILKPYKILTLGGKKVGFVGVTTPETLVTSTPKYFQDKDGKFIYGFCEDQTGEKVYRAVQRAVNNARKEGADYVFLVGHLGTNGSISYWSSGAMAANTYNIDAIIDGHSHELYIPPHKVTNKAGKDVLVAQTGTKLQSLGRIAIREDGSISSDLIQELKAADPKVTKLVAKENKRFDAILNQPVGEAMIDLTIDDPKTGKRRVRCSETNLGDFISDVYRSVLDTDIAMENGGSIRNTIKKGVFTYNDLLQSFPFGNMCTVIEATGQQIVDALEVGVSNYPGEHGAFMQVSGMTYAIDSRVPSGVVVDAKGNFVEVKGERRVKDVMVGGKPIDLNGKYTVCGSNYILKDGGNGLVMFKQSRLLKDGVMMDVDAIMEYVQNHLNAKIKEGYENPYGAGRIVIK
ncbi:MAG: bifunctional metallophosphatase/5'-nucleotidase [Acidaminococcaceae bacterium]|nr:bifunctional metallophosphatase/5'-nucleotidase [Acidaminococcaceae bacterium]